ncbi:MAG: bifunctional phosphoribosylaminoimidazolecarboxamide formyltransferase/IMP cyclohydrolase [Gemmatales bacterium]
MTDILLKRALLSVTDKTGLVELAQGLHGLGVELISTGGTRQTIADAKIPVKDISEVTQFPEMLDGRVKTLHPAVHAGILAKRDKAEHLKTLEQHQLPMFDLIVCNLYAFEETVARPGCTMAQAIDNIDIGGPTMIRAAAKNHAGVAVLTAAAQYAPFLEELRSNGGKTSLMTRQKLAAEAFSIIADYDLAIARYFTEQTTKETFPTTLRQSWKRKATLRYGENPHQQAAFYVEAKPSRACISTAESLGGKELSFNNLFDLDSALTLVRSFTEPAAVVIKHNNPCGAAVAGALSEAYRRANEGDPISAFGGIVGLNREVDAATAQLMTEPGRFFEAIIAPGFSTEAMSILRTRPKWKDSVRLLATGPLEGNAYGFDFRKIEGGLLVQGLDTALVDWNAVKVVTERKPSATELADLAVGWTVVKAVKSNAIVLAKDQMVIGVGAGQMSRIDSVQIAIRKAGDRSKGSVLASDAFFPFPDNVEAAAAAGVTAIAQPGGSVKDADSISACNKHGIAMVFTGMRHFKH